MQFKLFTILSAIHASTNSFLSAGGKFHITLACDKLEYECHQMRDTLSLATGFIENALDLKERINVNVEYLLEKDGIPWSNDDILGLGTPRSFPVQYNGTYYLFPRALLKQHGVSVKQESIYDITVLINPKVPFYFPSMFGKRQEASQYGAIDVISHELLHGMGFLSALGKYAVNSNLSPVIYVDKSSPTGMVTMTFLLNIFDKYVFTREETPIEAIIEEMNQNNLVSESYVRKDQITLPPHHLHLAKQIEHFATKPEGLYFHLNRFKVYLETSIPVFSEASSISHLALGCKRTNDMLMVKSAPAGSGIHKFAFDGNWLTSPYGDNTLDMMEKIGYSLNKYPLFEKSLGGFLTNPNFGKDSTSNSHPTAYTAATNNELGSHQNQHYHRPNANFRNPR